MKQALLATLTLGLMFFVEETMMFKTLSIPSAFAAGFTVLPAHAHWGHVGELAGHGHVIAIGAAAAAAALAAALARGKPKEQDEEEAELEAEGETA
ncbi:MAG: DUF6732 family protein [Rhizobiaceae bacterium]